MGKSHYPEAESQFRRALDIRQKTLEKNHPEIATALTDLALLLYYEEKYDEAKPLNEQALAIDEATLGPNHPNVANDLSNLALLLEAQKNYDGAESDLRRALAILEQASVLTTGTLEQCERTCRTCYK